jgi:hypothetical protein
MRCFSPFQQFVCTNLEKCSLAQREAAANHLAVRAFPLFHQVVRSNSRVLRERSASEKYRP